MRVRTLLALIAIVMVVTVATLWFGLFGGLGAGCVLLLAWSIATRRQTNKPEAASVPDNGGMPLDAHDCHEPEAGGVSPLSGTDREPNHEAEDGRGNGDIPREAPDRCEPETEGVSPLPRQTEPAPAPAEPEPTPEPAPPSFNMAALIHSVLDSEHPLTALRQRANDIRNRRKQDASSILPIEDFLERDLHEAGLFEKDAEAEKQVRIVLPHHSKLFYVRMPQKGMTYGMWLQLLRIEATLNALLFAFENFDDLSAVRLEDLYKLRQRVITSICAQAPDVDTADWSYLAMPWQVPFGPSDQGEWAVRQTISQAIESMRLPFRLEARFRCNVAEGDVAIEFGATPARAFPQTAYTQGLGIVPTTHQTRSREATNYAARVGILLAANAFHASNRIRRVWVSAIDETPKTHTCLYSVCMERRSFSQLRLGRMYDPVGCLQRMGASLRLAEFELQPVEPRFYMEDDRFCPPYRHDLWQLSERSLPPGTTQSLGCTRVSGLLIHEQLPRDVVADKILRRLPTASGTQSTQQSVHTVLETAHATSDITVWSAAERVATKLVEGTLDWSQPEELRAEFVEGDRLTKSVKQAQGLLSHQRPHDAMSILKSTLKQLDEAGLYKDSSAIVYRCFDSFVERVFYNRLHQDDKRSVVLAPDVYPVAHLTLSALYATLPVEEGGSMEQALRHARRALEVSPLSTPANLGVAACLEAAEDVDAAIDQLCAFLKMAFHNQSIGMAYFRLASLQWKVGNKDAARACYFQAIRAFPALTPFVFAEHEALCARDDEPKTYEMDSEQVEKVLLHAGIPLAPTNHTAFLLYDGAVASVDAEVFPVAHDLLLALESITGDDVLHGIRMSLEHEPDA